MGEGSSRKAMWKKRRAVGKSSSRRQGRAGHQTPCLVGRAVDAMALEVGRMDGMVLVVRGGDGRGWRRRWMDGDG